jgi:hypothetical protein
VLGQNFGYCVIYSDVKGVVQAPAPERLIKSGIPTEALVALACIASLIGAMRNDYLVLGWNLVETL